MITTAEIFLWGSRIGIIHMDRESPYASFEYDPVFLTSSIELSPICMPLSDHIYEFPDLPQSAFHGVPGLLADSLPDRFGNALIRNWLVSQGRDVDDFTAVDRLCYTGSRGMGALEYVPATGPEPNPSEIVDVNEMVRFASAILSNRSEKSMNFSEDPSYSQLIRLGTSAGGARAKAIIAWNEDTGEIRSGEVDAGEGFDYWLMKFDGVEYNGDHDEVDTPEYTVIEYAYYLMARKAGIKMNDCRLFREHGRAHFMTKRFDRDHGDKVHMQTLGAISHISYNEPGLCSYEYAAACMRRMGMPAGDIEQLFRRMVFNVLAVNQDDHVKNISFLMDRNGEWRLSPAYDVTFAYNSSNPWLSSHQMTVNGKRSCINVEDLIQAGANMDISTRRCRHIIRDVEEAVSDWATIAKNAGLHDDTIQTLKSKIDDQSAAR